MWGGNGAVPGATAAAAPSGTWPGNRWGHGRPHPMQHRWIFVPKWEILQVLKKERLVSRNGSNSRDSRNSGDSRYSRATKHQEAPRYQSLMYLSHTPWDAPAVTSPLTGTWRGGCLGGTEHLMHPGTFLQEFLQLWVLRLGWLRPVALVTAMSELRGTTPTTPALDSVAPSQPRCRSRRQPRAGLSTLAFPEQMAPAWGRRRGLSASFLSCKHSVTPPAAPAPAGTCRWGQRWRYILQRFS